MDKFCHPRPPLANELVVVHPLPPEWQRMLSTHSAPSIVIDSELIAEPRNVHRWALTSNRGVLMPARIRKVGDLVDASTINNPMGA